MLAGKVKWFNTKLGFGFLHSDTEENEENEVFVHFSNINMNGYRRLKAGQSVIYDIDQGEQGLRAINVTVTTDQIMR